MRCFGVFVLSQHLEIIKPEFVKLDMVLILLLCIILEIYKLNFEKIKANEFLKKHGITIFGTLLLVLSSLNLAINTSDSINILKEGFGKEMSIEDTVNATNHYNNLYLKLREYDNSLYRIEQKNNISINDSITFEFNGIAHSSSTYSKKTYDFLKKIGYSYQHVVISSDGGNTKAMDMLLGVKYLFGGNGNTDNKGYEKIELDEKINVYKNPYALSLAFRSK